jgi:hypothetical protein
MEISTATKQKVLTKYFFKDNQICFHLLLRNESEKQIFIGEYTNYADYRKSFQALLEKLENSLIIEMKPTSDNATLRQAA